MRDKAGSCISFTSFPMALYSHQENYGWRLLIFSFFKKIFTFILLSGWYDLGNNIFMAFFEWMLDTRNALNFVFIRYSTCVIWSSPYDSTQDWLCLFYILTNWGLTLKQTWKALLPTAYWYIIKVRTHRSKKTTLHLSETQDVFSLFRSLLG